MTGHTLWQPHCTCKCVFRQGTADIGRRRDQLCTYDERERSVYNVPVPPCERSLSTVVVSTLSTKAVDSKTYLIPYEVEQYSRGRVSPWLLRRGVMSHKPENITSTAPHGIDFCAVCSAAWFALCVHIFLAQLTAKRGQVPLRRSCRANLLHFTPGRSLV